MRDDNYQPYVLIGPDRKQQIESRLLTLRSLRTRTKPLDSPSRVQALRMWLLFVGGWLVLLGLVVLVLAILAGMIG